MNPDDLRAIAEKATPGPWHHQSMEARGTYGVDWVSSAEVDGIAHCGNAVGFDADHRAFMLRVDTDIMSANAAHIAAFNPSTCLALLDELKTLRAQIESIRKEATDAEREACAKIADVTKGAAVYAFWSGERACHSVAESIRARSNLPGSRAPTGDEGK